MKILITRPKLQAIELRDKLRAYNHNVFLMPLMNIKLLKNRHLEEQISNINTCQIAIFTSKNAVIGLLQYTNNLPKSLLIGAVGKGTYEFMQKSNIRANFYPELDYGSASLLQMPELQNVNGKKIALFTGVNSLTTIHNELTKRMANVIEIFTYETNYPVLNKKFLLKIVSNYFDIIVVTSLLGLEHLSDAISKIFTNPCIKTPLLVSSKKIFSYTQNSIFIGNITLADDSTDASIIKSIENLSKNLR